MKPKNEHAAAMGRHTFRIHLAGSSIDGTSITVRESGEQAARKKVLEVIQNAARDLKDESIEYIGTGLAGRILGSMGKGKKKTMTEAALAARRKGSDAVAAKATNPSRSTIWRRGKRRELATKNLVISAKKPLIDKQNKK